MEINIKRDLNETYLILPAGEISEVGYRILSDHPQAHLMKPELVPDGRCAFAVCGGNTLEYRYRKDPMTLSAVRKLFFTLEQAIDECRNCLLQPENLLLRPQLIIEKEDGAFVFLAHPGMTEDLFAGLRRLTHFCCENFAGSEEEQEIADRLRDRAEDEIFRFEDLLHVLGENPAQKTGRNRPEEDIVSVKREEHPLLLPAVFLLAAFAFLLLYHLLFGGGEPRLLLGSFVCLAASAGCVILRLTNTAARR